MLTKIENSSLLHERSQSIQTTGAITVVYPAKQTNKAKPVYAGTGFLTSTALLEQS